MPEACRWGFPAEVVKFVFKRLLTFSLFRVLNRGLYEPEISVSRPHAVLVHETFGMVAGS